MTNERALKILDETGARLTGHFILTSGRHSGEYMQCAKIQQWPGYLEEMCKSLAENFKGEKIDAVVGPATGGIVCAYELSRQLNAINMFTERVDGKMTLRRGFEIKPGMKIVVSEDVITSGGSVTEVIDVIKQNGGLLMGVAVLVDRSNGKIDFGTKLAACYTALVTSYKADECPLCKQNIPAYKPGSRGLS